MSRFVVAGLLVAVALLAWGVGRAVRRSPNGMRQREPVMYAIAWMALVHAVVRVTVPWVADWNPNVAIEITRWADPASMMPLVVIVFGSLMRPWMKKWRLW